jgi:enoyl-CoA hydratase/carnithine racemase
MRAARNGAVLVITLDRPDRLNALTFEVYAELVAVFRGVGAEVRAVVIRGEGKAFCSGGDVEDIIGKLVSYDMQEKLAFTRMTVDLIRAIRGCRAPVIAQIQGTAAGAGAVIALASDFRIAGPRAKMAFLFNRVGLAGADMGAAHLLPRVVGLGRATEMLMLGDAVDASQGLAWGLFHRVVPGESLDSEVMALAERLASGPAFATAMTKEALNRELDVSLDTALEMEAQAQAICMQHGDFAEASAAWAEGRKPRFR